MKGYKVLLFDMDGTLVDAKDSIFGSIRVMTEKMGLREISHSEKMSFIGPPLEDTLRRIYGLSEVEMGRAMDIYREYAMTDGIKDARFYDGIEELIKRLKPYYKLGVVTLKNQPTAELILKNLNASDCFDFVFGREAGQEKTKAMLTIDAVNAFGCDKKECVLIGDSEFDAIGAKEAGVDFIALTYGFGFKSKKEASHFDPIAIADSVDELFNILV